MNREDEDDPPPFAFGDAECARLVRDHMVCWRGMLEEALSLPGMYEMIDGWLYVWRTLACF